MNTEKGLPQIGERGDIGLDRSIFRNTGIVFQVNALEGEDGGVGGISEVPVNAVDIESGGIDRDPGSLRLVFALRHLLPSRFL
ncbi:MAG: hypothetical protein ACYCT9_09555 [Leptospirillum sp.]